MKRFLYSLSFAVGLAALPCLLFGQRTITGTVTDAENGEALIGANVLAVGAEGVGTSTDIDGTYAINLPEGATALQFSYTGYTTEEVTVGASNVLDISLKVGSLLEEVVIIGYGEVKREDATGSITSVGEESFNRGAITSPQALLNGKVAGVQIINAADPGGGAQIRIRGGSSLSASNDPLIVIDGVPIFNSSISGSRNIFNFVNPNDIESFVVLKDASATAIYGSRASNGVILITTKSGNLGKVTVTYNGNVSFSEIQQAVDVLSADEYRTLVNQEFEEGHPARDLLGDANTNWNDEIYQTATGHDHNVSFMGGVKNLPYRASVGYTNMDGILKSDKFQRFTGSLNLTPKFFDSYLRVNASFRVMQEQNDFGNRGAIGNALGFDPTQPVLAEGGNQFGGYTTWLNSDGSRNTLAPTNPVSLIEQYEDKSTVNRYVANGSIDYRFHFLPELRANLNLGYDYGKGEGNVFADTSAAFAYDAQFGGGIDNEYELEITNELLEFYLNYVKEVGSSKFDLMGGYSWQHLLIEDSFRNSNIAGTPSKTDMGVNANELFLLSLYGRLNYTLLDRYLFTFTLREDATSRFSPDTRKGLFPAAAFAWKVVDNGGKGNVSSMKLRLGWGITGQESVGGFYDYQPRYTYGQGTAGYNFGGQTVTTVRAEGFDEQLKWEETTTYNAGLDFGFLNERITGTIDYYRRETKDLLNFITVPAGSNLTNAINTNIGDLENEGIEVALNITAIDKEDFDWVIGTNFTRNTNEITKLTAVEDSTYVGVLTGGISGAVGNTIQVHSVGFPTSSFFVSEQVYNEDGNPIEGLYVDRNGDGVYNEQDMYRLEKPAPDYFFGLTSSMNYKNLEFSFAARANVGNYIYNNIQFLGGNTGRIYHPTNYTQNVHSSVNAIGFQGQGEYFSDYFIQNGSFLRVDHITLGYDFAPILDKISWLKLSATLQNPILITKYDGVDPEINDGIDNNIYPRSRVFILELSARF